MNIINNINRQKLTEDILVPVDDIHLAKEDAIAKIDMSIAPGAGLQQSKKVVFQSPHPDEWQNPAKDTEITNIDPQEVQRQIRADPHLLSINQIKNALRREIKR